VSRYFEGPNYGAAWKGLQVQTPEIYLDVNETPRVSNFWFRDNELRSTPPFAKIFSGPELKNPCLGTNSFMDANGVIHTVSFTSNGLFQLSPFNLIASQNPWVALGGSPLTATLPVASRAFANLLYYTNGAPYVQSWDGISNTPVIVSGLTSAAFGGPGSSVGGFYLYEINFQICLLNCNVFNAAALTGFIETASVTSGGAGYAAGDTGNITTGNGNATYLVQTVGGGGVVTLISITNAGSGYTVSSGNSTATGGTQPGSGTGLTIDITAVQSGATPAGSITNFPQRLWYSANGIPNQWDPSVNESAGFVDFLDVPDVFTGVMPLGAIAYLFRTNGITQQTITGSSLQPYYFDHLWDSEKGIGSVYPYSIAQYGSVGFFVSTEQIYKVSINSFQPIGGGARDAIMADLALASATPTATVIPAYAYGFIYLTYRISIPMGTFTRHYLYSIEDSSWTREDSPNVLVTGRGVTVWR
jgi:hypothetical protein